MPEEINILHVSFHKDWRGGEQQATYLFEECLKKNCLQWVLCSEGNAMEQYCEEKGYPHYSFKKGFFKNFKNRKYLFDLCEKHHIQIIHAHDSQAHTLAFISCLFGNPIPIVVHRRVDFPVNNSYFSKLKYNIDCVKKYICVSHRIKEVLEPSLEDPSKITVIHSGIDVSRFEGKSPTGILRKEFQVPDGYAIIGNISALADHKDYFTFINTAQKLIEKGVKAKFLIIGDGPMEEEIRQYIAQKNLSDHIIMTGFRTDIPDVMPEFDIFLFTSKTEGLGTTVLDAFACGVPVVATQAGGIPEMVEHEQNGLLAPIGSAGELADQCLRVLNKEIDLSTLKNNAKKTVSQFSKEKMAERVFQVYKELYYKNS